MKEFLNQLPKHLWRIPNLALRIPWRLLLAATSVLFVLLWSSEREARLRQAVEVCQVQQQAEAEISALRTQAAAAWREANQRNAEVIRKLDSQRQKLEREGESLRQRLAILQQGERDRVEQVAALPTSEVVNRLAARLGPEAVGGQVSGVRFQGSGAGRNREPSDIPRPTAETPEREKGRGNRERGTGSEDLRFEISDSKAGQGTQASGVRGQGSGEERTKQQADTAHLPPDTLQASSPESRSPSPALSLTDQGVRKVETSLVELDACREQKDLVLQQLANCQEQVKTNVAIIGQQSASLDQLNQALTLKDEILARRQAAHQAELKAARGTRSARLARALKYIAAGVVMGALIR